ncbi:MAG: nucleoside 2-deoxyribosyltransferase [Psychrobacillus psychrodurans]
MKFYIASSFQNIKQVRELAELLMGKGWKHTYDWTDNLKAESYAHLAEIGKKEMNAVSESDLLIVILPAGKGSHIEMGIALALEKSIYLFSTCKSAYNFDQTSTFYHVDGVNRYVGDLNSFSQYILMENLKNSSI